jgi:hypothetical protein
MKKRMNNELITEYYRTATNIPKKLHRRNGGGEIIDWMREKKSIKIINKTSKKERGKRSGRDVLISS